MLKKLSLRILAVTTCLLFINTSELTLDGMESIKISLLPESEGPVLVSDSDKAILRYGFHRTHDCQNFEKAFICVRKCLDLQYQIAHADKSCVCTCYKNSVLAQYKAPIGSTKWKLGAPTTSVPPWAGGNGEKIPNDYEINANYTEFNNEPTAGAGAEESGKETTGTDVTEAVEDDDAMAAEVEMSAPDDAGTEATEAADEGIPAEEEGSDALPDEENTDLPADEADTEPPVE